MRWIISAILLACARTAGAMGPAAGQAVVAEETPTQLEGVQVVAPEELRRLLNQGITVYDLRKKASYADGHVPGAVSAAAHYDAANNALDVDMLGPDRSSAMVFYRSEEHTSELQSLMRISYAVFCLNKKKQPQNTT